MTLEGYFDGTAVKILEPANIKINQKVFINIPNSDFSDEKNSQIQKRLDAVHSVFGMLSPSESATVDESISKGIKFKEIN